MEARWVQHSITQTKEIWDTSSACVSILYIPKAQVQSEIEVAGSKDNTG